MKKIKKVYFIHHSHFDLGYTHPQDLILEFQEEYISQAIDLCETYKESKYPFKWTIEATLPLIKWLADADEKNKQRLADLIHQGFISVTALLMHTTPLNDAFQIKKMLEYKKNIEDVLDIEITTAINHDVNGQSWTFSDMLLDSGVNFYLTGENIHFGGIPFPRPKEFYWQTPSKRKILSFLGEHYSLFSQFMSTDKRDIKLMQEGLRKYIEHLYSIGYNKEYIFLTATNPPLLDNNPPDSGLVDLISDFNRSETEFEIEFILPEQLRDLIINSQVNIDTYSGDWTDFWNFGAGSTPNEIKYSKIANQNIKKTLLLESFASKQNSQFKRIKKNTILNSLLYNEHTWGASDSVDEPTSLQSIIGKNKKASYCFNSLSESAFILNDVIDDYIKVDKQNELINFISVTNTTSSTQKFEPVIPKYIIENKPCLTSFKANMYLHGETNNFKNSFVGPLIELEPYETRMLPVNSFKNFRIQEKFFVNDGRYETKKFFVTLNSTNGVIESIVLKKEQIELVTSKEFGFFDLIVETIDSDYNEKNRATFFPRDIEKANYSKSVWNHNWVGKRERYIQNSSTKVYLVNGNLVIETEYRQECKSVAYMKRKVEFNDDSATIKVTVTVKRETDIEPTGHYLAIPAKLKNNWELVFDSAETLCRLDEDQLGNVSKDWITIGNSFSVFDAEKGMYIATGDAPLIQVNGFSFGRESKNILRNENPLLLSWIYNNYWNTNFSASDDNEVTTEYLIKPFKEYSENAQIELGIKANNPIEYNWSKDGDTPKLPFKIVCQNTQILSIERLDLKTIQLFVKNYTNTEGLIFLSVNDSKIEAISEVTLSRARIKEYQVKQKNTLYVSANSFKYFEIKLDK